MRFIDTHVHFFDPNRKEGIVWPPNPTQAQLPKDFAVEHKLFSPDRVIAIETSPRFIDDVWLLNLARETELIAGVILNLEIESELFESNLNQVSEYPEFKGLRLRPIKNISLGSERLRQQLSLLPPSANIIEAGCPTPALVKQFYQLALRLPELIFVLDHIGHPNLRVGQPPDQAWVKSVQLIAGAPNVIAKITGLIQFSVNGMSRSKDYEHTLQVLVNAFGEHRIMYGSNWPLVKNQGGYQKNVELVADCFKTEINLLNKVMRGNAERVYKMASESH